MATPTHQPPALEYSSQPPSRWKSRRFRRRFFVITLTLLATLSAFFWEPPLQRFGEHRLALWRAERLYQQASVYTPAEGEVVYDESVSASAEREGYRYSPQYYGNASGRGALIYNPPLQASLRDALLRAHGVAFPNNIGTGLAFLHQRIASDGQCFLIAVGIASDGTILCDTLSSPALPGKPLLINQTVTLQDRAGGDSFQYLAGRADPKDPSRFTIPYRVNGQADAIDGQILPGGLVSLKPRSGWIIWQQPRSGYWFRRTMAPQVMDVTGPALEFGKPGAGYLGALACSPDGNMLAVVRGSQSVELIDSKTGQVLRRLAARGDHSHLTFSPDGAWLLGCGTGRPMSGLSDLWDVASGKLYVGAPDPEGVPDPQGPVAQARFSADGKMLYLLTAGSVQLWDMERLHERQAIAIPGIGSQEGAADLSSDCSTVAVIHFREGSIGLYDLRGNGEKSLAISNARTTWCAFSPDGQFLVSGADYLLHLYRTSDGKELLIRAGPVFSGLPLTIMGFSRDGRFLAAAGGEHVWIWDMPTCAVCRQITLLAAPGARVLYCATQCDFSPDGKSLWVGRGDGTIQRWDLQGMNAAAP